MGFLSRFENTMEDGIEGAASAMGRSGLTPVQITKKAEKQMKRERIVGAGKQYAPTLYTVLVSPEDDRKLFKYYPTLAGETETYLVAKAREHGYVMDGKPLVRFITDSDLKRGKFDVVAEMVASSTVNQLRNDELERYGLLDGRRRSTVNAAAAKPAQGGMRPLVNLSQGAGAAVKSVPPVVNSHARDGLDVMADGMPVEQPRKYAVKPALQDEPSLISNGSREISAEERADNASLKLDRIESVVREAKRIERELSNEDMESDVPVVNVPIMKSAPKTRGAGVDAVFGDGSYVGPEEVATTVGLDDSAYEMATPTTPLPEVYLYDEARDVAYQLSGLPQQIGRESANDIVVPDINISRVHAEIHCEETGQWVITDLNSTNGLYINGRKIRQAPLRDADMITLGTTTLEFQQLG